MQQQLISIENVPISVEYNSHKRGSKSKPALESLSSSAKLNITTRNNHLTIRSNPIKIELQEKFRHDTRQNMSYTATADYANDVLSMNVRIHPETEWDPNAEYPVNPPRFHEAGSGIDRMVDAVPRATIPELPFNDMKINFFVADMPGCEELADGAGASFIPPEIEMAIVEYPKVVIKYIGGPIYFPYSADPNYKPPVEPEFEVKA